MDSSTSSRLVATILIWALLMAAVVILSQLVSPTFGELVKVILLFFTAIGIGLSGFVWNWGRARQEVSSEERKRNRLTMALRDLSDDELKGLRQRLSNGDIDDDQLARLLDESEAGKARNRR